MARIRTIKPSFFTSLTIADLTYEERLTFIGLWTHVDDNGRCVADPRLIKAAIWPLDNRTTEDVEADLGSITDASLIRQYKVGGRRYLQVNGWREHQVINRPKASAIPGPDDEGSEPVTSGNAPITDASVTDHGSISAGRERKGRERISCASADAEREAEFEAWYAAYPRKRGKGQALKAYRLARKSASAEELLEGLTRQVASLTARGAEFVPYPATWLNGQRWLDEVDLPAARNPAATPTVSPWDRKYVRGPE